MTVMTDGCTADPAADWQEQGWCCRECAILAHLEWCKEHGVRCGGEPTVTIHLVTHFYPDRDPITSTCDCAIGRDHDSEGNLHD